MHLSPLTGAVITKVITKAHAGPVLPLHRLQNRFAAGRIKPEKKGGIANIWTYLIRVRLIFNIDIYLTQFRPRTLVLDPVL